MLAFLTLALLISVTINIKLWPAKSHLPKQNNDAKAASTHTMPPTDDNTNQPSEQLANAPNQTPPRSQSATSSPQLGTPKQQQMYRIRQQIAAGEFGLAQQAIQDYLRGSPQDIEFLLLEAELVKATALIDDVMSHYYGLLDLALTTEQRAQVLLTISQLSADNIEKLKTIKAWDVLATFLEPLWQFDPNRRSIILALAESYARQGQEFLMENVLASLPQGDLEGQRIRQVLVAQLSPTASQESEDIPVDPAQYERSVSLTSLGDHFIAPIKLGRYQANLMIDTGASTTVITTEKFRTLNRRFAREYIGTFTVNTAGGQVAAPIFQFKQVFIGGFRIDDVAVVVLDMPDFSFADGLLGMNLLRQFDFKIDQKNQQLLLNRL
ncbi:retroviral-like aspartic protease family protein [Aliiglaciecola sp.]|nr:retroviral-like aspartic protease family protein [Aliiglaciecola sp.]